MVSSYTANLAAFLTVESVSSTIKSAEDLKECGNDGFECPVMFGAKKDGSTINFFKVLISESMNLSFVCLMELVLGSGAWHIQSHVHVYVETSRTADQQQ